jgi:hypothetical protein
MAISQDSELTNVQHFIYSLGKGHGKIPCHNYTVGLARDSLESKKFTNFAILHSY